MRDFKNLLELTEYFSDEDVCREHLEKFRWTNGEPVCPFCGSIKVYRFTDGKRFKCGEKECAKIFSVLVGTMLENTKIPLQKWFAAMYLITSHKKGISSLQLSRDISVTQRTAWFLNHRIREMLVRKAPGVIRTGVFEADETFVGGKNKNRHAHKKVRESQGRSVKDKTPVLGMVERLGDVRVRGLITRITWFL